MHLRRQVQRPGRGHQPDHRQHQRQPGGDERPEREQQDQQRHRPRDHLGLQHRRAVRGVEVRPHRRGAGQMHLHPGGGQRGQLALQPVRRDDHRVGIARGAGLHDRGVPVTGDRHARGGRDHGADRTVGAQRPLDVRDSGLERRVADGLGRRVEDRHQPVARQALEVLVDQLPRLDRLRAGGLPPGARESGLDARGEEPEHDRDQQPRDQNDPEVGRGVAAKTADRPDLHSMPIRTGRIERRLLSVEYGHQTVTSSRAGRADAGSPLSVGLG